MVGRFIIASVLFLAAFIIRETSRHPMFAAFMAPWWWLPFALVPIAAFIVGSIKSVSLGIVLAIVAGAGYAFLVLGVG